MQQPTFTAALRMIQLLPYPLSSYSPGWLMGGIPTRRANRSRGNSQPTRRRPCLLTKNQVRKIGFAGKSSESPSAAALAKFEPDNPGMDLKNYSTGTFDRGAPRWKEALWFAVKCLFFLNPWPWPSALRVTLLRAFGARIGQRVVVRANAHVTFPWRLMVGDDVWIGEEALILSLAPVEIGSNVSISQRAFLCTGSHNFRAPGFHLITKSIKVGSGSWIAAQAFIGPGVTIGPGSMISAGSVVIKDVPPRTIARGNPAVSTAMDQNRN